MSKRKSSGDKRTICIPQIFYNYEDDLCSLEVSFVSETGTLRIRGGKHSFSKLAEICAMNATLNVENDHDHWTILQDPKQQFIIALKKDSDLRGDF